MLYNPDFNCTEFGTIKNAAGSNNFVLSVKTWIERTNAIGIRSKAGRYGGTYAHRDIAYHFGMWISPKFQLLLVKEYQRLKAEEHQQLGWPAKRELSKINYRIHTDAIKQNLIPSEVTPVQANIIYANNSVISNLFTSIKPLSVIFNSGITDKDKNAILINGSAILHPIFCAESSSSFIFA